MSSMKYDISAQVCASVCAPTCAVVITTGTVCEDIASEICSRAVLDLPPIRDTQTPHEVIAALGESADAAISKINELRAKIADHEKQIEILKGSDSTRAELVRLQGENVGLKKELEELLRTAPRGAK